jgi:SagB-type dehydrogenase family enzyme
MFSSPSDLHGQEDDSRLIPLPEASHEGAVSVAEAIAHRRSVRSFTGKPLTLSQLAQILWAAQGVSERRSDPPTMWGDRPWIGGLLTTPSAGALYPLELYAVVSAVQGLRPGTYRYVPSRHALALLGGRDLRAGLAGAALGQTAITEAPVNLVIASVVERTAVKYGSRAERYVHIEVGACAENVFLQAEALGLGTVIIGAFRDDPVREVLDLPTDHAPFVIMPIGQPSAR